MSEKVRAYGAIFTGLILLGWIIYVSRTRDTDQSPVMALFLSAYFIGSGALSLRDQKISIKKHPAIMIGLGLLFCMGIYFFVF